MRTFRSVILEEANYGGLPLGCWVLDETNGVTAIDFMGQARTGNAGDGAYQPQSGGAWTGGTLGVNGPFHRTPQLAASFTLASLGYVDCGNPYPSSMGTSYTVEAFFKPPSVVGNFAITGYRSTAAGNPISFQMDQFNAGVEFVVRDDAGTIAAPYASTGLTAGQWAYCVGTRSGNNVSVQIDAGTPATGSAAIGTISPNSLNIGALVVGLGSTRSVFFNGPIAVVCLYGYALAADRTNYHRLAMLNGFGRAA